MNRKPHNAVWNSLKPLLDIALFVSAFGAAYWVRYDLQWIRQVEPAYSVAFRVYWPSVMVLTGILSLTFWMEGAYRNPRGRLFFEEFVIVLRSVMTGVATMIVIVFIVTPSYYSRLIFIYTGVIIVLLLGAARAVEQQVITWRRRRGLGITRVLLVGAGEVARSIMRNVVACPELGYQIVGFLDDDPGKAQTDIGRYTALGVTDRLPDILSSQAVDEVIITLPWTSHQRIIKIMTECERLQVNARIVPDLFQMTLSRVVMENLNGIPLLGIREPALRDWQRLFKRATDVLVALVVLLFLSPLLGVIALAIKLDSSGPVIFRQRRVGKGGQEFTCFKFRSMHVGAEAQVSQLRDRNEATGPLFKMRNDPRRTRVGRLLRRTSLDELPQFWNVLIGEMSVIGPRPPLPDEVNAYEPWHLRRLEVWPGITGLWQVSGRSDLTFDEMVLLDIYYIENWSPFLDMRILLKTLPTMLFGSGAY